MTRKISLGPNVYLTPLDRRSGRTFDHYKHRVDIYRYENAIKFINWCRENLGDFVPWNLYQIGSKSIKDFEVPNWTVRYQEPGSVITEIFIHPDLISFVLLTWQEQK